MLPEFLYLGQVVRLQETQQPLDLGIGLDHQGLYLRYQAFLVLGRQLRTINLDRQLVQLASEVNGLSLLSSQPVRRPD